ncbi:hypothetical protein GCM10007908_12030 [Rhizobium albus]|nr:hypothetical protein GCM10007908_12030 [Rhizobium albus]
MLCTSRVLEPACETGDLLYVSLELLKRLEAEQQMLERLVSLNQERHHRKSEAMCGGFDPIFSVRNSCQWRDCPTRRHEIPLGRHWNDA